MACVLVRSAREGELPGPPAAVAGGGLRLLFFHGLLPQAGHPLRTVVYQADRFVEVLLGRTHGLLHQAFGAPAATGARQ